MRTTNVPRDAAKYSPYLGKTGITTPNPSKSINTTRKTTSRLGREAVERAGSAVLKGVNLNVGGGKLRSVIHPAVLLQVVEAIDCLERTISSDDWPPIRESAVAEILSAVTIAGIRPSGSGSRSCHRGFCSTF